MTRALPPASSSLLRCSSCPPSSPTPIPRSLSRLLLLPFFPDPHWIDTPFDVVIVPNIPGSFPAKPDFLAVTAATKLSLVTNKIRHDVHEVARHYNVVQRRWESSSWDAEQVHLPVPA
jgi:hypothetical protein